MPTSAWYGDEWIDLAFPDGWDIDVRRMAGETAPALTGDEIRDSLRRTLDTPTLSELAAQRERAVILFDDLTRPAPVGWIAPFVIEELLAGGMKAEQIGFVAALGSHLPMTHDELVLKLGQEIVERFPVFNHNCYENLVEVGETTLGTKLLVNREVINCDLRVGIGGSIPYWSPGNYGGGAKIVMPGICGIDSIQHHHFRAPAIAAERNDPRVGALAEGGRDALRVNMEEAAGIVGLDVKVDIVINARREPVKLLAGDPASVWRDARRFGNTHYVTDPGSSADIVVVNSYPQEEQIQASVGLAAPTLRQGGDLVALSHSPKGIGLNHYLHGRWGTDYGGREWSSGMAWNIEAADRVFVISPHLARSAQLSAVENPKVRWYPSWEKALPELTSGHGSGTRVNVFPYAAIQTTFIPALS
ncbi:MAG: lactate racemase domain-containing protein [Planctomycetota bacterium]|nr:lactate racemase domain-containing protein [Planctomycetota bacterium]